MAQDGKIKVLQFPIANSKGGITQYILQNWKFIDKSRFQFDFATMSKKLDFEKELKLDNCNIFYISCYAEENKEQFKIEFREILQKGKYDVVHLHTKQWKSTLVEEIAKEVGVKRVIVHAHSTGIDTLDLRKREMEIQLHQDVLERLEDSIATDFWTCSKLAADFLFGNKIASENIVYMPNAIDLEKFAYNKNLRNKYRKELHIKDNEIVIGNIGRMVYQKNQLFLLKVFKKICDKSDDFRLLLVGTGELENELRDYVKVHHLESKVDFLGFRKDVYGLLQAFDIFCLPSRFEGFPISVVEAHASGLRCIVSDAVTEEIEMSKLVSRIPMNEMLWVKDICNYQKDDRAIYARITRDLGYEIKEQILYVQKGYECNTCQKGNNCYT